MIEIELLDKKLAKDFIEKHHYSRKAPVFLFAFGAKIDDKLAIVVMFSNLVGRFQAKELWDKGDNSNTLELSRMATSDTFPNLATQAISASLKYIKKHYPQFKIVVSLADNSVGHNGYVYQAANFIYYGKSRKSKYFYLDNERIHERSLYDKFGTCSIPKLKLILGENRFKVVEKENNRKNKYYTIIAQNKKEKRDIMKQIKVKSLPYPKEKNTIENREDFRVYGQH